jgi:hypothetical protein
LFAIVYCRKYEYNTTAEGVIGINLITDLCAADKFAIGKIIRVKYEIVSLQLKGFSNVAKPIAQVIICKQLL